MSTSVNAPDEAPPGAGLDIPGSGLLHDRKPPLRQRPRGASALRPAQRGRWLLLSGTFFIVVLLAATLGAPVPLSDLWSGDGARVETARQIFLTLRLPRVLAGVLVGASLATSGAALQAVFRNPLAEPYLLGISAGGALGATIALAFQIPAIGALDPAAVLAFLGSLAASLLVYQLGQTSGARTFSHGGFDRAALLLSGVALSSFITALMALVVTLSPNPTLAQQTTFWLLGGLTNATMAQNGILAVTLVAGLVILMASARDLNALRVGDEEAASLGVEIGALHRRLLVATALMSSAAVATAGLIGFVGLLAPHLMRLLFSSDARAHIPAAALGGACLLVGCDALARSAVPPIEVPVGIITALLGVPLFLFLARRA